MSVNPVGPEVKHFGQRRAARLRALRPFGGARGRPGQGVSAEVERLSTSQASPTLAMVTVTWFL